jgi:predicted ATPase
LLELRATVSLSRLWQQQGKSADAYRMLVEVYGWFTEGFNTPDLQEAQALLQELASYEESGRTHKRNRQPPSQEQVTAKGGS